MVSDPAREPDCMWVTCEGVESEPGSLYCKVHGRQARQEGMPWRRPGAPIPIRPTAKVETPSAPSPAEKPSGVRVGRPLQPAMKKCRREGCDEPPLERTLGSKSNRWRNLCERHYAEERMGALGPHRRQQIEEITAPAAVRERPATYAERASRLNELAHELDAAAAAHERALEAWRAAVADLV